MRTRAPLARTLTVTLSATALLLGCASGKRSAEAPTAAPANPQALGKMVQGVQAARDEKSSERAIGLLEQAVAADTRLWEAHYNLGVLLANQGDLAQAERHLTTAQSAAPNAEDVAVALSEVRRRRGDRPGAIAALEPFVKQNPTARVAPVVLVGALRQGGKLPEAIAQARRVLVRYPGDPLALSELALSYLDLGEIDTAELVVSEALKAEGGSAAAERTAGLVELRQGDDAVAFRHFARASELDPNDGTARTNVGTVLLRAGVYDRAAEQFRAVLQAEPDNSVAALGLAAARRGQATRGEEAPLLEAEKLLRSVLAREPRNFAASFNLGVLYAQHLKRPADAVPLFQQFLSDAPSNHPARPEAERQIAALRNQGTSPARP